VTRVAPWALPTVQPEVLRALVEAALAEDLGEGDVTTDATVPADLRASAVFVAKQELVVAGLDVAFAVFQARDAAIVWGARAREGDRFGPGHPRARPPRSCAPSRNTR
jgi:nicotinate-nucleotide pyrophosphorylase (carboxylating)